METLGASIIRTGELSSVTDVQAVGLQESAAVDSAAEEVVGRAVLSSAGQVTKSVVLAVVSQVGQEVEQALVQVGQQSSK